MSYSKRAYLEAVERGDITPTFPLPIPDVRDELAVSFPNLPDLGTFHLPLTEVVHFMRKVGSDAVAFRYDDTLAVQYRASSDVADLYTEDGVTLGVTLALTRCVATLPDGRSFPVPSLAAAVAA